MKGVIPPSLLRKKLPSKIPALLEVIIFNANLVQISRIKECKY